MKRHRVPGRGKKIRTPALTPFLLVLCVGALGFWGIAKGPSLKKPVDDAGTPANPAARETNPAALVAPKTQSLAPKTTELDLGANGRSGLEVTVVQARPRQRSPLESSPGYYPPDDPESLSVLRGRRDAPVVEGALSGGEESLQDLARALLEGIEARDEGALHALRVTRAEFERFVWPELPESRPVTNLVLDEVWGFGDAQSVAGAGRVIGLYGGRDLTFLRVDYSRADTFRNFILYRDVRILIRDPKDGRVISLGMAPSVMERHERYKALIFKD
jgi:hypothetical protein